MSKKNVKTAGGHEHVWVPLVYGLPTPGAADRAKRGLVVLARSDRRDGQPRLACAGCDARQ